MEKEFQKTKQSDFYNRNTTDKDLSQLQDLTEEVNFEDGSRMVSSRSKTPRGDQEYMLRVIAQHLEYRITS